MPTKLCKWGNSIGLRIPRNVVDCGALKSGDEMHVRLLDTGDILVRTVKPQPKASLEDPNGNKPLVPARANVDELW